MFRESGKPRLLDNTGVIVSLGCRVRELVDSIDFTALLEGYSLDKIHAYLA